MIETNSVDIIRSPLVLMNQTESANLIGKVTTDAFDTFIQQMISKTIYKLADRTDDGGVLLTQEYKIPIPSHHGSIGTDLLLYFDQIAVIFTMMSSHRPHRLTSLPNTHQLHRLEASSPHLEAVDWIKTATGFSQKRIGKMIGVTRQAINDWRKGLPISDHHRQRLFAVRDILERAWLRHPTRPQLIAWLDTPRGSDGRTPAQLLEANEINRARLLAVSSPSTSLKRAPAWVNRPIPEAFRAGAERRQEALPPDTDHELVYLLNEMEDDTDKDGEDLPQT